MLITHACFYLTDWNAIKPRQEDYTSAKIVDCLKGDPVRGYFNVKLGGVSRRYTEANKQEFLDTLFERIGIVIGGKLDRQHALVPIPNSAGVVGRPATYKTLTFARAVAASSKGKLVAVDALRWIRAKDAAHKQGGMRKPEPLYDNLKAIACPREPIILFDDVITSGSSFVASCWRLEEAGNKPKSGLVVARRTVCQEPEMFKVVERELDVPRRPLF